MAMRGTSKHLRTGARRCRERVKSDTPTAPLPWLPDRAAGSACVLEGRGRLSILCDASKGYSNRRFSMRSQRLRNNQIHILDRDIFYAVFGRISFLRYERDSRRPPVRKLGYAFLQADCQDPTVFSSRALSSPARWSSQLFPHRDQSPPVAAVSSRPTRRSPPKPFIWKGRPSRRAALRSANV